MPYFSEDTDARRWLPVNEVPTSFGDVLEAQFASSVTELPLVAGQRIAELESARGRGVVLTVDEQVRRLREAGLEGDLQAEDGLTDAALDILIERKQDEIRRTTTIARGRGGVIEGAARLGVAIGTSFADPVSAFANFVPIVGEARYLRLLGQASMAGRVGVRAAVGAAEGAVGAALIEPLVYGSKVLEQADYSLLDSLLNVGFGGIAGSTLHVLGGTAAEGVRRGLGRTQPWDAPTTGAGRTLETGAAARAADDAPLPVVERVAPEGAARIVAEADPEIQDRALQVGVGQMVDGRSVNVESLYAGERGLLADGRSTEELLPDRFAVERTPVGELLARTQEAMRALEARVMALGERPRVDARTVARYERLRAAEAALGAAQRGEATPEQVETIRQAAVAEAVRSGAAVPNAALRGADEEVRDAAIRLRNERIAAAAQEAVVREADAPQGGDEVQRGAEDITLQSAETEAATAEALAAAESARVGLEEGAGDQGGQIARDADRWALAAEIAQACLLRGA